MKCTNNIVKYFVSSYCHKGDDEYQEIIKHIVNCKKCFTELIRLAPEYDSRVEENQDDNT